jgi:chorismate--pyruvate lyase
MSSASPCSIDPTARARGSGDVVDPIWLDDADLRAAGIDERLREWLTSEGLLTERIRTLSPRGVRLRLRGQHRVMPDPDARALLDCDAEPVLAREIELLTDDVPLVFARTLIPETTLRSHPWLRELGETPLGEALAALPELRRGPLEFAGVPMRSELYARALENLAEPSSTLWMRRSWFGLPEVKLLVTEVFLPAVLGL